MSITTKHCCNKIVLELPCSTFDLVVAKTVEVAEIPGNFTLHTMKPFKLTS